MSINSFVVPRAEQTKTCHRSDLQILANFQSKRSLLAGFLVVNHERVFCEPSIDKSVYVNSIKSVILDISAFVVLLEMDFEDIPGVLRLLDFKIFSKIDVELWQELIWNDWLNFFT